MHRLKWEVSTRGEFRQLSRPPVVALLRPHAGRCYGIFLLHIRSHPLIRSNLPSRVCRWG